MNSIPPQELLDATHKFPCTFPFKAIGRGDDAFIDAVVSAVREELRQDFDPPFEVKHTTHRRHVAVTVNPWVESAADVLQVFERIRTIDGLVMLL